MKLVAVYIKQKLALRYRCENYEFNTIELKKVALFFSVHFIFVSH